MAEVNEVTKAKPDATKAKGKKSRKDDAGDTLWSRRDFFSLAGWASFMSALGLSSLYFLRLLFPLIEGNSLRGRKLASHFRSAPPWGWSTGSIWR